MDPYIILKLPKNYTLEQLKKNYKTLVVKYHPDKNTDVKSTQVFQTLTFAYTYLLNELKSREDSRDHSELKKNFKGDAESHASHIALDAKKFDLKKFNMHFAKYNKEVEKNNGDRGYGDWLKNEEVDDEKDNTGAIIHYDEPMAMDFLGSKFGGCLLGEEHVDDYSKVLGGKGAFMDIKKAHTTTKLVDDKFVENRPIFKDVDEIKRHREDISFVMDEASIKLQKKKEMKEQEAEEKRLKIVKDNDNRIVKLFDATHKFMLKALR
jgi:hypothetical protein